MRELDPQSPHPLPACTVVGAGRLGTVLAAALSEAPALKRDEPIPASAAVVLLAVPDAKLREVVPGTTDQPHTTIIGAGHFLQEDSGEELAKVLVDWLA